MLHDLLFPQLADSKWGQVNLNEEAAREFGECQNPLLDAEVCSKWVENLHKKHNIEYSWGGWMEDRATLWRGHYHKPGHTIHLGIDYNVPAWTEVFLPYDGVLMCAEHDPDQEGGWGRRAIYQMKDLFVIFAHLGTVNGRIGSLYPAGSCIGIIGTPSLNGNWFPHLHVQCMRKYNIAVDGYASKYANLEADFPNPEVCLSHKFS